MTQAYRALHHNGGMVVKYPGCFLDLTRFNHPQTDNFIQLLFRDAGMQAKFGNSKSHRNISHYAFPQSLRGSKDDWASASCCHSAAVFSSGFGGITIHLVEAAGAEEYARRVQAGYRQKTGIDPEYIICAIGDGATSKKL